MILPADVQLYFFLTTIIAGLAVGIMFDIYKTLRGFDNPGKLLTIISDLLFWILAAILIFIFFLYSNHGYLRYNSFIGLIIGLYVYFRFISKPITKALRWSTYYVIKFFRMLIALLFYPIRLLRYFIRFLFNKTRDGISKGYSNSKKQLAKVSKKHKKSISAKKEKK
jgi:spore cortex biosynthesis protein YabQ